MHRAKISYMIYRYPTNKYVGPKFSSESREIIKVIKMEEIVRFICDICEKNYKHQYRLKYHIETAHKYGSYKCDYCEKVYNQRSMLKILLLAISNRCKPSFVLCGRRKYI